MKFEELKEKNFKELLEIAEKAGVKFKTNGDLLKDENFEKINDFLENEDFDKSLESLYLEKYAEEFYETWKEDEKLKHYENDLQEGNPAPYGCPWYYIPGEKIKLPKDFFGEIKEEILELAKKDESNE